MSKKCPVGVERHFHPLENVLETFWRHFYAPLEDAPKMSRGDISDPKMSLGDIFGPNMSLRDICLDQKYVQRDISGLKMHHGHICERTMYPRDIFIGVLRGHHECLWHKSKMC